jgi:hypothetical protein
VEIFIGWIVFSILVGVFANSRGRSGFGYFILSLVLSPLIMFIVVAILGDMKTQAAQAIAVAEAPAADTHVRCPECRELVRKDARKCKHCSTVLVPQQ